jgi:hypothetical protein
MGVTNFRKPRNTGLSAQNPGVALDLDWLAEQRVNRSATERRAQSLSGRRTVKKDWQAAWWLSRSLRLSPPIVYSSSRNGTFFAGNMAIGVAQSCVNAEFPDITVTEIGTPHGKLLKS